MTTTTNAQGQIEIKADGQTWTQRDRTVGLGGSTRFETGDGRAVFTDFNGVNIRSEEPPSRQFAPLEVVEASIAEYKRVRGISAPATSAVGAPYRSRVSPGGGGDHDSLPWRDCTREEAIESPTLSQVTWGSHTIWYSCTRATPEGFEWATAEGCDQWYRTLAPVKPVPYINPGDRKASVIAPAAPAAPPPAAPPPAGFPTVTASGGDDTWVPTVNVVYTSTDDEGNGFSAEIRDDCLKVSDPKWIVAVPVEAVIALLRVKGLV